MTRAREAARLIGNNTFRLDSNNAVGFNSTSPDAMFDIDGGLSVTGIVTASGGFVGQGGATVTGILTATTFVGALTGAATQVTVADESSDTTCFPLFATAATGNLEPKSGSNLTFNSNSGTLEATNLTLSGDLTVNGTTVTLDTAVQEVDLINVQANSSTPAIGVTQSGSGNIISAYDGTSEVFTVADGGDVTIVDKIIHSGDSNCFIRFPANDTFTVTTANDERLRVDSSGRVLLGTTTEGSTSADNLTIRDSGHCGVTIRSGTTSSGSVYFSDATSGSGEYEGYIQYNHSLRQLNLGSRAATRLIITEDGADFDTTGSVKVPVGTTAQRPTGVAGDFRYNSTLGQFEGYTTEWGEIGGGGGITTTASAPSANTIVYLDLGSAQYHELALSAGITTISCSNGNVGESHVVVINQPSSGIATVGFDTYFEFPSGAAPSMSEGGSAVDMVSFVVKKAAGAGGTELLASAGLNYQ